MSPEIPLIVEPASLAASGERLEGQLRMADLERVSDLVLNRDGTVKFDLTFMKDDHGMVNIIGKLSAQLTVRCQRCLNGMSLQVDSPIHVGVVDSPAQITELPDVLEPVVAEEHKISIIGLIEEELLLAMPLSPLHERDECPATRLIDKLAVKKASPFAVLKDLKTGKQ